MSSTLSVRTARIVEPSGPSAYSVAELMDFFERDAFGDTMLELDDEHFNDLEEEQDAILTACVTYAAWYRYLLAPGAEQLQTTRSWRYSPCRTSSRTSRATSQSLLERLSEQPRNRISSLPTPLQT